MKSLFPQTSSDRKEIRIIPTEYWSVAPEPLPAIISITLAHRAKKSGEAQQEQEVRVERMEGV